MPQERDLDVIVAASYAVETGFKLGHNLKRELYFLDEEEIFERVRRAHASEVNTYHRAYPNHYILRGSSGILEGNIKHLWPIAGLPSIAYIMISILNSERVKKAVFVGPAEISDLLNEFKSFYSREIEEKGIKFKVITVDGHKITRILIHKPDGLIKTTLDLNSEN